ncbi:MAG TPA: class I SAM-dependent methyltransferase [Pseudonocardia sp.]|jgi:ubiquinone/menaquinone biosynthesis C-methylase UbiE|uniref:class I SAM-dependent DNA methyltransferase n=1 Tax=Pseudonocardia sp. TaxID=60912 RepID=UPI002B4B80A7|nr:class I SAM-dependent methyltransferase [Pseudonocardia sp.]HLU58739.1 class I SAM-dependent methyltransferase [Pseudonocardia sp.]
MPAVIDAAHLSATRAGYDAMAERYAAAFRAALEEAPLDRALLTGFAELVRRDHPDPQVLEVGSGPGRVTAFLHGLGLSVRGIDLSPAMVELARREHPGIGFAVGDMGELAAPDASLAGLVAWYSLIHVPAPRRPAVVAGFHRVLRPGGYALLAFQVGDDTLHLDEAFGHEVSLEFHRLQPDEVATLLTDAGFEVTARLVRTPEHSGPAARVPQGFLIARRR